MTYVFKCVQCNTVFEKTEMKFTDPYPKCSNPDCTCEEVIKVPVAFSFVLKGGGWAKDAYVKKVSE